MNPSSTSLSEIKEWDRTSDARDLEKKGIEVWAEFERMYLVSNFGRVVSCQKGNKKLLSCRRGDSPYVSFSICNGNQKKTWLLHRAVVTAFDGEAPSAHHTDVRHLDNCKTNNKLSNLKWGTRSENMMDVVNAKKAGIQPPAQTPDPLETKAWRTLSEDQVSNILSAYGKGCSIQEISALIDYSRDVIGRVVRGETWAQFHVEKRKEINVPDNGRVGPHHHLSSLNDFSVEQALKQYVRDRMSSSDFADLLKISKATAKQILSGKTWRHIQRPEGFQYPWIDASSMNAPVGEDHSLTKLNENQVREAILKIANGEFNSVREISAFLDLSKSSTWAILENKTWTHIQRPDGFQEKLNKMLRPILKKEEQEEILRTLLSQDSPNTRKELMNKFNLSQGKLQFWVTKANKARKEQ